MTGKKLWVSQALLLRFACFYEKKLSIFAIEMND